MLGVLLVWMFILSFSLVFGFVWNFRLLLMDIKFSVMFMIFDVWWVIWVNEMFGVMLKIIIYKFLCNLIFYVFYFYYYFCYYKYVERLLYSKYLVFFEVFFGKLFDLEFYGVNFWNLKIYM